MNQLSVGDEDGHPVFFNDIVQKAFVKQRRQFTSSKGTGNHDMICLF
jgi:hypothetical protein